jgi:hypothetical protein
LKSVFERTPENHPDQTLIPKAMEDFKSVLENINIEVGKAENAVKLTRLQKQLQGSAGDMQLLMLRDEGRLVIREGKLTMKRGGLETEISVFLFDHVFVMTTKKDSAYKIMRKVI